MANREEAKVGATPGEMDLRQSFNSCLQISDDLRLSEMMRAQTEKGRIDERTQALESLERDVLERVSQAQALYEGIK